MSQPNPFQKKRKLTCKDYYIIWKNNLFNEVFRWYNIDCEELKSHFTLPEILEALWLKNNNDSGFSFEYYGSIESLPDSYLIFHKLDLNRRSIKYISETVRKSRDNFPPEVVLYCYSIVGNTRYSPYKFYIHHYNTGIYYNGIIKQIREDNIYEIIDQIGWGAPLTNNDLGIFFRQIHNYCYPGQFGLIQVEGYKNLGDPTWEKLLKYVNYSTDYLFLANWSIRSGQIFTTYFKDYNCDPEYIKYLEKCKIIGIDYFGPLTQEELYQRIRYNIFEYRKHERRSYYDPLRNNGKKKKLGKFFSDYEHRSKNRINHRVFDNDGRLTDEYSYDIKAYEYRHFHFEKDRGTCDIWILHTNYQDEAIPLKDKYMHVFSGNILNKRLHGPARRLVDKQSRQIINLPPKDLNLSENTIYYLHGDEVSREEYILYLIKERELPRLVEKYLSNDMYSVVSNYLGYKI